jgi:hypothetical protein
LGRTSIVALVEVLFESKYNREKTRGGQILRKVKAKVEFEF